MVSSLLCVESIFYSFVANLAEIFVIFDLNMKLLIFTLLSLVYGPWVHNVSETGFTVLWMTDKPSLDYVEVAPDDGTAFHRCERPNYYEVKNGRRVFATFHSVRVESLTPGTSYRYRIISKEVMPESRAYKFVYGHEATISPKSGCTVKTLSSKADTCRFSMMNDIHFNDARFNALSSKIDPERTDFIVLCGDIVSKAESIDTVIKHTFAPIAGKTCRIPLVFVKGNHEGRGKDFDKVYPLFPSPTGEFYYTFRQGPAAFIVLDGGEDKPDSSCEYGGTADYDAYRAAELAWLKTAVKDGKNYPVIANSNSERMDVEVTGKSIILKTFDAEGKQCHQWEKRK